MILISVDLKALLAGANMQNGNPHDLEKPMSNVLGAVQDAQRPDAQVDEGALASAHAQAYNQGHADYNQAHQLSTESMGAAAAIQAFKDFAGAGTRQAQEGPGSQSLISKLVGMAMSEAVKVGTAWENDNKGLTAALPEVRRRGRRRV